MRIPGLDRRPANPAQRPAYLERRPGESNEAFEARLAAAAAAREDRPAAAAAAADRARREGYADAREDHRRATRPAERPPRRRGGLGAVGLLVVLVAALGVLWIVLAAREGSFAGGGAVVDQKIAQVTQPARDAATRAVDRTGQAVETAGQKLESQGEKIRQSAK